VARLSEHRLTFVVMLVLALIYIPFAGSYGLFDPWETHYGEVARSMLQRGDYLTTWWQDEVFKSKPVLTFWLQALGMATFGVNQAGAPASEMALSTAPEWGMRLPVILVSLLGLYAIFLLVSRLATRRAAVFATLVCATCPQYALITRQSITDIPFVALLTAALCFFLLGLFADEDEEPRAHTFHLAGRSLTVSTYHVFLGLLLLLTVPQILVLAFDIGLPWHRSLPLPGGSHLRLYGLPYALPWLALLGFFLVSTWTTGARRARHVYVHLAWLLCGLAVLAKGLGGVLVPAAVVGVFLLLLRDPRRLERLELLPGLAVLFLVAAPWHHGMWIRHGQAFWGEYFVHHHFKRAQLGVHGERGSFDYFVHQLGIGMFPWTGLVPVAVLRWLGLQGEPESRRDRLVLFALVWAAVAFGLFALMETKFHHYALPAIPPLAILLGLFLDDVIEDRRPGLVVGVLVGAGLTLLVARDLVRDPYHLVQMFIYKYDRLFPYELGFEPWIVWLSVPILLGLTAFALPAARRFAAWVVLGGAVLFTLFAIDVYLPALAPHWGQKNLWEIYYRTRRGPQDRLIAWQLNWRGENYYSKNQVVVHMQPKDTPIFKAYLGRHRGERFYVIMEQGRFPTLKSILGELGAAGSLELVGPGGQVWPDHWVPHFRMTKVLVLFRERPRPGATCERHRARLSAIALPEGVGRFKATGMPDTWWSGPCRRFVDAERRAADRACAKPAEGGSEGCQRARQQVEAHRQVCQAAERELGAYPYLDCFEYYPNDKFLLARFTP
jgi:4-amino-4-deoxy-L-arabinose transferase-like glycosyltransferase